MNESFRVLRPRQVKGAFALLEDALGAAVMDVIGGEHRDCAMTVLGVVTQGKNERQNSLAAAKSGKRAGKPGWYFRVLNWASEKGLSSLTWGRLRERVTPRSR